MPVQTPHPLYSQNAAIWRRCRDAYDGEDAVKAGGETYLPRVDPSQSPREYDAYKMRASYYEAVARTIDGFVGSIARKAHTFDVPAKLNALIEDATLDGTGLLEFTKLLCREVLTTARGGVLVDFSDEKARAYLAFYAAEAILSWDDTAIVLSETVFERDAEGDLRSVAQLRRLSLEDGRYTVTLFRKSDTPGDEWTQHGPAVVPMARGQAFKEMPFVWLSSMGCTARVQRPPLLGLVNIALSHYRSSADLEHGRHFTGLPTLYVTGANNDDPIRVGSGAAIVLSDPASKVGYAEFSGQGLGSLENALETKEAQMAVLGAMVFGGSKKGVEAAETARIRTSGETSLLAGVASSVEEALRAAFAFCALWMAVPDNITIQLNREFVDVTLDPMTLQGLVKAYQAGAISLETFLFQLQQSDMLRPETDIDAEAKALRKAAEDKAAAENAAAQAKPADAGT